MFNYMNVGFVQNRSYDEKIHAKELGYGMRDCVMTNDDFVYDEANHRVGWGRAIMGGTPVRLGSTGEYFDLPVGYSGPVTLKRVLNGTMSTVEMITAAPGVNDDTTYYFKLYDITTGVVSQDYRSIDWVHSFYLKNMGGSNIAWVLNGFTSETFDASALAGNRTLLNDKDIGYDDTIHDNTLLKDILKDIFDKTRTLIGTDKPFILNFDAGIGNVYNPNLGEALKELILNKYGYTIVDALFNFKWTAGTGAGFTRDTYSNLNKIELWSASSGFYFEFEWDYNGFDNVIVLDRKGYTSGTGTTLYASGGNNEANITLSESMLNFDEIVIRWKTSVYWDETLKVYTIEDDGIDIARFGDTKGYASYNETSTVWTSIIDTMSCNIVNATTLAPVSSKYVIRTTIQNNGTSDNNLEVDFGIVEVIGYKRRPNPRVGTIGSLLDTLEELPRVETPNIEPEIDNGVRGGK